VINWRESSVKVSQLERGPMQRDGCPAEYRWRSVQRRKVWITPATTPCLKKSVPPLQLAIIFTYTVSLRQFLAQMLPRKNAIKMYFIFPPHLLVH